MELKPGWRVQVLKPLPMPRWPWQKKKYMSPDWIYDVVKVEITISARGTEYVISPHDINWERVLK